MLLTYLTHQAEVNLFSSHGHFLSTCIIKVLVCVSLIIEWINVQLQEIQKIVVFEGAFEKIFSIIKEEGGSEGGVVVQVLLRD